MCLADARGHVLLANAEFCTAAGLAQDAVVGAELWQLFAATPSDVVAAYEEARLGRTIESATLQRRDDEAQLACSVRMSRVALPEADGVLLMLTATATLATRDSGVEHLETTLSSIPHTQLEALLEASPVPLMALDPQGRGLMWSRAAERLFGFQAHEVIGKRLPTVPSDKVEEFDQLTRMAQQQVVSVVTERVSKDGRRMTVNLCVGPLRNTLGHVVGNVAVLVDLTDQQSLRRALKDSEQRFVTLFEANPVASVLFRGRDHAIVEVNRAFLELARMEREHIIGRTPDMVPVTLGPGPEDRARLFATFDAQSGTRDFEYRFRWPNGELRDAVANVQPIEIAGERYVLFATRDVTAPKRVERELIESNARFQQLAETIREVFWLSNPQRHELIYISPAYAQIFGRSVESLYADPASFLDGVHPDDRERIALLFAAPSDWSGEFEFRVVLPDGTLRWIRSRTYPVRDEDGQVIRIAGAAQDITYRRTLEAQLQQTQRLESIGLLAGGIAHDFNNLLTVILGSCDVLRALLPQSGDCSDIVEEIHTAGERAAGLTRQLLSFSRRSVMETRVLDLRDVVIETEKLLRRILGEDVRLTTALPTEPVCVRVDAGAFGQLLMNLAVNARDAMPRGGNLRIALTHTQLDAAAVRGRSPLEPGPHALLSVSDDGTGIPASHLPHIFEPFFTTKEAGKGTGLGLSVAQGIVSQHGGHIEVDSAEGQGTSFRIYVPLLDADVEDARDADVGAVEGSERLLLVEDDVAIRRVASRVLSRLGYTVLEASNGRNAIELLEQQRPQIDLVITDVVMPEMSGRELAEALLTLVPKARLLYTSGYTDDAVLRHGIQHADVAFLRKPYTPIKLARKIRELFDPA